MIFGSKPVYIYGQYNKKKFHCLGKSYAFDRIPVQVSSCPLKLVNDRIEVFFPGPIFNTYVLSVEENVTILKSYDDKLTIIKNNTVYASETANKKHKNETKASMEESKLYTVKVIAEDESSREVELYKFDEFFPGTTLTEVLEVQNGKAFINTKFGKCKIHLQSNEIKKEVRCMLAKIEPNEECVFVEIDNPVERAVVRVVKDLNNNKIVENGNIKGILLDCKNKKIGDEVSVYVKNAYIGSYAFVEDIKENEIYTVELMSKQGNISKVKYKDFVGECYDKKVSKEMKGTIYDIKGGEFKFKRYFDDSVVPGKRTEGFEPVKVQKRMKITSEDDIKKEQLNAVEYIKNAISENTGSTEDILKLFNKYILKCNECDYLCLFYLDFLMQKDLLTDGEINKMLKNSSPKFFSHVASNIKDPAVLKMIYNKKRSQAVFLKLLAFEEDKIKFIKENPEYITLSIGYIYENIENPRILVENVIDKSFRSWMEYVKREEGQFKRNLFRRMSKMNFKKNDMKTIFKMWLDFEESQNGNIEEVHSLASQYIEKQKKECSSS